MIAAQVNERFVNMRVHSSEPIFERCAVGKVNPTRHELRPSKVQRLPTDLDGIGGSAIEQIERESVGASALSVANGVLHINCRL